MPSSPGGTMSTKMTHTMRMEFAGAIRGRYAAAANKDKSRILEEFVAATGYHEKSAIRISHAWPPVTSLVRQPVTELRGATRQRGRS